MTIALSPSCSDSCFVTMFSVALLAGYATPQSPSARSIEPRVELMLTIFAFGARCGSIACVSMTGHPRHRGDGLRRPAPRCGMHRERRPRPGSGVRSGSCAIRVRGQRGDRRGRRHGSRFGAPSRRRRRCGVRLHPHVFAPVGRHAARDSMDVERLGLDIVTAYRARGSDGSSTSLGTAPEAPSTLVRERDSARAAGLLRSATITTHERARRSLSVASGGARCRAKVQARAAAPRRCLSARIVPDW